MRAEVVSMTGENLDMDAIKRAGDILKRVDWSRFLPRLYMDLAEMHWIRRLP